MIVSQPTALLWKAFEGEWFSKQGLPLSAVSDQLISRYIDQFHKRITLAHPYGQRSKLAHGLGHLLVVLRQAGVVSQQNRSHRPRNNGWLVMTNT
jgi:hypothetical protein